TLGKTKETGTEINFLPDGEIFERIRFKAEWLKSRLHETAYLNPDLHITYVNKRQGEEETVIYHEPDGIIAYVRELNAGKDAIHDPIYFKGTMDKVEVEVSLQFVDTFEENILGFCNNIFTQEGGTHLAGFKTRFTQMINNYARELGILKEKDANFTGADTRNGLTAVVAVKHPDPIFEGQTKTKLASADATKAVFTVAGDELQRYFDRNLEVLKAVISCAEKSAKIRKAEEKAKTNMLSKSRFSFDSNGKLANCESRDAKECEIFIVEGDSAGGSAKTARNRQHQAILPIRGKILNVEKASMDKVLANAEIKTMINTFGCGFSEGYGNDFDISKLRYHKIVLMTDADVDGSHIDTLLLTFLYRFMPELIYNGHVFIAMPPLFKVVPKRGEEQYLYDEKELERYRRTHTGEFTLQRYKGLGEMDAEQLWETTLDPERRVLKQVEIEDARMASEITEMLMGSDVPPRRQFIYEHADEAEIDA
ncbi:MAG: toprim domain-containing protein, partial [Lacrimispora sphenoides]